MDDLIVPRPFLTPAHYDSAAPVEEGIVHFKKRHVMAWMGVLGDMRRQGSHVIFTCACGTWGEVDVEAMIGLLGKDGSLWDRQPPCENPACSRLAHFMASPGRGTPVRPLISQGRGVGDLPAQAWMGGWTGML